MSDTSKVVVLGEVIEIGELAERIAETENRDERASLSAALAEARRLRVDLDGVAAKPRASEAVAAAAERFLDRTRELVRDAVAWERERCPGVPARGPLAWHDLARLERAPQHDGHFSPDNVRRAVAGTALAMGVDPPFGRQVRRGLPALREMLTALGRSVYGASADPAGGGGESDVESAWAALFERLAVNASWLRRCAQVPRVDVEAPLQSAATAVLLSARRAAAAVDASSPLRGWILEAALQRHLRDQLDEDWFDNPRAKSYLAALAADPSHRDADAVSKTLGATLDPDALAFRFEELLG